MQTQWLTICKRLMFLVSCIVVLSCDPDDRMSAKQYNYNVALENMSESPIVIYGYKTLNHAGIKLDTPELKNTISIASNSFSSTNRIVVPKSIEDPAFGFIYPGFENSVDSIILKFSGNRGYYKSLNNNDFWLANKSNLLNIKQSDIIIRENILVYNISQLDYENAHILP